MTEYTLEETEFVDVNTRAIGRRLTLLVPLLVLIVVMLVVGQQWVALTTFVVSLPPLAVLMFVRLRQKFRRSFADYELLREPIDLQVDDQAMRFTTKTASYVMAWHRVKKWRESRDHFLLFESDMSFRPVPKRALSEGEQNLIREKLQETKVARM